MIEYFQCRHPEFCKKCSLGNQANVRVVHSILPKTAKVLFVGESPGGTENSTGVPFTGSAGELLNQIFREVGIDRNEVAISNVVACRPEDNRQPTPKEAKLCMPFLDEEIQLLKPELIIPLGAVALKQILPGTSGITSVRGQFFDHPEYGCKVMPALHPAFILRAPMERSKLVSDLNRVSLFMKGNHVAPQRKPVNYYVVNTIEQFDWLISQLHENTIWSCDTETTALDFLVAEIFIVTFSWKEYTSVLVDTRLLKGHEEYVWKRLKEALENDSKKIFQNGAFDIKLFLRKGIYVNNFYADTMLMHYLLDENADNGLEVLAYEFTDMGGYDLPLTRYKLQNNIESYDQIPQEIIHPYANADADVTFRSYNAMKPLLTNSGLDFVFRDVMIPTQTILLFTEYHGVSIDVPYLKATTEIYGEKMEKHLQVLSSVPQVKSYENERKQLLMTELYNHWEGSKTLTKKYTEFTDYVEYRKQKKPEILDFSFNINSSTQLKELLIDRMKLPIVVETKKGNPSLNDEALQEYAKTNAFCKSFAEYRTLSHLKSTFLDGMLNKADGSKIHTHYLLQSTVTGRPSSREPNLNNIPRTGTADDIKDIFMCDNPGLLENGGDWLAEADLGQAEFRIWINYSQDPQALEDLSVGIDIHKLMASAAYHGITLPKGNISYAQFKELTKDVTKDERQNTKMVIFGVMFGRGAKSVSEQLGISVRKAQEIIDQFFGRYPKAQFWLKTAVAQVMRDGYITNLFGRRRRIPDIKSPDKSRRAEAERQSVNSPIQCVSEREYVLTNAGYIRIEKLQENNVKVFNGKFFDDFILNFAGKKEEYETMLRDGSRLLSSGDHKLPVFEDGKIVDKKVADLKEGDAVVTGSVKCCDYIEKTFPVLYDQKINKIKGNLSTFIPITCLDIYNENVAYLVGVLIGDGSYNKHSSKNKYSENIHYTISVALGINKEYTDFIKNLFEDTFKCKVHLSVDKKTNNYGIHIYSVHLRSYLKEIGLDYVIRDKKEIPEHFLTSPVTIRCSLLRGLFDSDGTVRYDKVGGSVIGFSNTSYDVVQKVKLLLSSLGIFSKIFSYGPIGGNLVYYNLWIDHFSFFDFAKHIGFYNNLKRDILSKVIENYLPIRQFNILPNNLLKLFGNICGKYLKNLDSLEKVQICRMKTRGKGGTSQSCRKILDILEPVMEKSEHVYLQEMISKKYSFVKHRISTGKITNMWDIFMKDQLHPYFVCNSILTHNSGASDYLFLSMVRIHKKLWAVGAKSRLVLTVYDSQAYNIPDNELKTTLYLLQDEMKNHPFQNLINVPVVSDIKVGTHWGSLMEVNLSEPWDDVYNKLKTHRLKEIEKFSKYQKVP